MWTLVHKQLIHNTLLIILGFKSAEDYQYLAEYQSLIDQRARKHQAWASEIMSRKRPFCSKTCIRRLRATMPASIRSTLGAPSSSAWITCSGSVP